MRPSLRLVLVLWAVALAQACRVSPTASNSCPPAPVSPACPDAVPDFARDVYPDVFHPVCVPCHGPGGEEANMPFTSYQLIYGAGGSRAREIYDQVFESCLMPPASAPQSLSPAQRQKLLDWFGCGAPGSGTPPDAGS